MPSIHVQALTGFAFSHKRIVSIMRTLRTTMRGASIAIDVTTAVCPFNREPVVIRDGRSMPDRGSRIAENRFGNHVATDDTAGSDVECRRGV